MNPFTFYEQSETQILKEYLNYLDDFDFKTNTVSNKPVKNEDEFIITLPKKNIKIDFGH